MGEHTGKWCNVHDITREVILSRFDELGFCQVLDKMGKNSKEKLDDYQSLIVLQRMFLTTLDTMEFTLFSLQFKRCFY